MNDKSFYNNLWNNSPMGRMGCGSPVVASIVLFVVLFFSSCATKTKVEYRDREVVKYNTQYVHDTTFVDRHDSVFHTIFQKGDTVYDTKYIERTRYRDRIVEKHDTCYRDVVQTEYKEMVKEVVKIPKIYTFALVFSIIVIIFAIYKLTRWLRTIL